MSIQSLEGRQVTVSFEFNDFWYQTLTVPDPMVVTVGEGTEISVNVQGRILSDTDGDGDVEPVQGPNGLMDMTVSVDLTGNSILTSMVGQAQTGEFFINVNNLATSGGSFGTVVVAGEFTGVNEVLTPQLTNTDLTFGFRFFGFQPGTTVSQTIFLDNEFDDDPQAFNDSYSVFEGGNLSGRNVLDNDIDLDNGPLGIADVQTITAVNGAAANVGSDIAGSNGGLFSINADGMLRFETNGNFQDVGPGAARNTFVTYTVSDESGSSDSATATVTVNGLNDPVVFDRDTNNDGALSTIEAGGTANLSIEEDGGPLDLRSFLQADDIDGNQTLNWSVSSSDGPDQGQVSLNGTAASGQNRQPGTAHYMPVANASGTDSFTIQVDDGGGSSDALTLNITINDAPEVTSINRGGTPGSETTNADTVEFDVTFSEAVNGVDTGDFSLSTTGSASGSIDSVSATSGTTVTVMVGGVAGDGTIRLDLADDDSITSQGHSVALGGVGTSGAGDGSFTTGQTYTIDNTAPSLASSTPADDGTSFAVGANLTLTFSETINLGSGTITLVEVGPGTNDLVIDASSPAGQLSVAGSDLTIDPSVDLRAGTEYAVHIAETAIQDGYGYTFSGIADDTTLNFTTQPRVALSVDNAAIGEQAGVATFTVELRDEAGNAFTATDNVTVTVAFSGTASGTDYSLGGNIAGSDVTIPIGESSKTFTVTAVDDGAGDTNETVIVDIDSVTNGSEAATQQQTVTLVESDPPVLTGTVGATGFAEGGGPVALVSGSPTVTDADSADFDGGSITISLDSYQAGDSLSLNGGLPTGASVDGTDNGSGTGLTINFNADIDPTDAANVLGLVQFENTSTDPTAGGSDPEREVTITVRDGDGGANTLTGTLGVSSLSASTTQAAGFDTTAGMNLVPAIAFGGEDETLTIGAAGHLDNSGIADGGGGTDVLAISFDANLAQLATLTGFETLRDTSAGDVTVTLDAGANGFTAIDLDQGGASTGDVLRLSGVGATDFSGITLTGVDAIQGDDGAGDTITGTGNGDVIDGRAGADTLSGAGGADTLTGGAGEDDLDGGAGDDVFLIAAAADHTGGEAISGGAGADEIRFTSTTASETLSLSNQIADSDNTIAVAIADAGGTTALNVTAAVVTLTGGVTLTGNAGANSLTGSDQADSIDGGAGADTLVGGAGSDSLTGGGGTDRFEGAAGDLNGDEITDMAGGDVIALTSGLTGSLDSSRISFENASDVLTIDVDDDGVGTGSDITVTLTGVADDPPLIAQNNEILFGNSPPQISDQTIPGTVAEDTDNGKVIGTITASDDDPGLDGSISFSVSGGPGRGAFNINNTSGEISVADSSELDFEGSGGATTIKVTVSDSGSPRRSSDATITINLADANDAPSDIALSQSTVDENVAADTAVGTLTATDQDTGDTVTFSLTDDAGGRFRIDGDTLEVASGANLDFEAEASHTVTVKATDSENASFEKDFTISLVDVNEAVTALPDTVQVNEDAGTVNLHPILVANDTDPDAGTTLNITAVDTTGTDGSVSFDDGKNEVKFIADAAASDALADGEAATTTFDYTVSDGTLSDSASVAVTINGVNDAPTATDDTETIDEDGTLNVADGSAGDLLELASDPDNGDTLSLAEINGGPFDDGGLVTLDSGASLVVDADGSYAYDPSGRFESLDIGKDATESFTFTVQDAAGERAEATVTITITGVNDGPTSDGVSDRAVNAGDPFTLDLKQFFSDPDDVLTFSQIGLPTGFTLTSGVISGSSTAEGSSPVTVTAEDDQNQTASEMFDLTVLAVNTPPTSTAIADQTVDEDADVGLDLSGSFTEPDAGDGLTFSATGLPAILAIGANSGTITGSPTNADVGTYPVTVTATDGSGETTTQSFDLTVANTNDAPTVATPQNDALSETEGTAFVRNVGGTFDDVDANDDLTISAGNLPAGFSFNSQTDIISGTPDDAAVGIHVISLTATDEAGATTTDSFILNIANINDAPVSTPIADATTPEDASFNLDVSGNFSDPDITAGFSDALVYNQTGLPQGLALDPNNGVIAGTPDQAAIGTHTVAVTASDIAGASTTRAFVLTVTNVNDPPVVANALPNVGLTEDDTLLLPLGDVFSDPDGDALTIAATSAPSYAEVLFGDTGSPILRVAPDETAVASGSSSATETITLTATDGDGQWVNTSFDVEIQNVFGTTASRGYIRNATVFGDENDNRVQDADESSATTDADGDVRLEGATGTLVQVDGTDISTNRAFDDRLLAPEGSSIITPLTTLIVDPIVVGTENTLAEATLKQHLGIDASYALTSSDHITLTAVEDDIAAVVATRQTQVHDTASILGHALAGLDGGAGADPTDPISIAYAAIAGQITDAGGAVDFTNVSFLEGIVNAAETSSVQTFTDDQQNNLEAILAAVNQDAANDLVTYENASGDIRGDDLLVALAEIEIVSDDAANALQTAAANGEDFSNQKMTYVDNLSAQVTAANAFVGTTKSSAKGTPDPDTLAGLDDSNVASVDVIGGLGGDDQINGGAGDDRLFGDTGNDLLRGDAGNDELTGGAGTDTADYDSETGGNPVTVDLSAGTATDTYGDTDSLTSIENVIGTAGNDDITGDANDNTITGNGGADTIDGGAGDDTAVFSGNFSAATINQTSNTEIEVTIGGSATNLTDIENLKFDDRTFSVPTDIALDDLEVAENSDGAVVGTITVTDPNGGDTHTLTVNDSRFEVVSGQLKLKAGQSLDHETEDSIEVKVTASDETDTSGNPSALFRQETFTVTVTDGNDAPTKQGGGIANPSAVDEDEAFIVDVSGSFTDADVGDDLSFSATGLPAGLSIDTDTGVISGIPGDDAVGTSTITVTATDEGGLSVQDSFDLTVTNVNDAPEITSGSDFSVASGQTNIGMVQASDPDMGDTVAFALAGGDDENAFNIDETSGALSFKSARNSTNPADLDRGNDYEVRVKADDGKGGEAMQTVTVSVTSSGGGGGGGGDAPTPDPEPEPDPDPTPGSDGPFIGDDPPEIDNQVDLGLEPTAEFEATTVDGAPATTGTTTDSRTGETVDITVIDPAPEDGRNDTDPTSSGVDVPVGDDVTVSGSGELGLIATRRVTTAQGDLRILIASAGEGEEPEDRAAQQDFLDQVLPDGDPNGINVVQIIPAPPASGLMDAPISLNVTLGDGDRDGDGQDDDGRSTVTIVDVTNLLGPDGMPVGPLTLTIEGEGPVVIIGAGSFLGGEGDSDPDIDIILGDGSPQVMFFGPGPDTIYGAGGGDRLSSAGGNDALFGNTGDDTLDGGEDNDVLTGGGGDDVLHGGDGTDTAAFEDLAGTFQVETSVFGYRVTQFGVDGTQESDLLIGIEILNFSDRSEPPDSRAENGLNLYAVVTDAAPPQVFLPGSEVTLVDAPGGQSYDLPFGAALGLSGVTGGNTFNLEGAASDYTMLADGTTFFLIGPEQGGLALVPDTTPQTLVFAEGSLDLTILDGEMVLGGETVPGALSPIAATPDGATNSAELFDGPVGGYVAPSSEPNLFGIVVEASPAQLLRAGTQAKLVDAPGPNAFHIAEGAGLTLSGSDGANVFRFQQVSTEFTAALDGGTLVLTAADGAVTRLPADSDPQTLVFADGAAALTISGDQLLLGETPV
ncbi:MAG: tandem-95 repeat protein, partial [Alphaproteobacteria bacterium]|nr:tandem-95 repeat protein [Alphaproteobacteria bacterium]